MHVNAEEIFLEDFLEETLNASPLLLVADSLVYIMNQQIH